MFKILYKKILNPTVTLMKIEAPLIAKKARAGQFIILRVDQNGERIPLTIADYDSKENTITIIFQIVGATTLKLNQLNQNDFILDIVGPLGNLTETEGYQNVAIIGGGVGCAIAYPIAKQFYLQGSHVETIIGFRNKDLIILEDEFSKVSHQLDVLTDDGSYHKKGFVTLQLEELLKQNHHYDLVMAIGPLMMMKAVCDVTKKYNIKTIVSMNSIMIDGTGMCGCCRLSVAGKTRFACVDGPDFDGHLIDFDEAIERSKMYISTEKKAYDHICNLLKEEK